jgi:hypothetical protein
MKDEIKEIELDHFNNIEELKRNVDGWIREDDIYWNRYFGLYDLKTLLDYITNLQEENEKLKENIRKDEVYFKTFELAEECDQKQDIIDTYKSRIDKASGMIEFIAFNSERPLTITELNKVYNILQGSDEDE